MTKRLITALLCLVVSMATMAQGNIRIETLTPHFADGGQGVAGSFTGCVDGRLIVAGGCNFPDSAAADGGSKRFYSTIWKLSNHNRGWKESRDVKLPQPTAYGASVHTGTWMVCMGGTTDGRHSLDRVYRLNNERLEEMAPLPVGIDNMGAAMAHDGHIYVAGGQTDGKAQTTVYRMAYPNGTEWEAFATIPGQGRLQPAVVAQGDGTEECLYILGGYDPETKTVAKDIIKVSLTTGECTALPGCEATAGMRAVASGGSHILVFGGVDREIFEGAMKGEWGDDYLRHDAGWYKFNPNILVYHTITNSWYEIAGRSFLARAGAGLATDSLGATILIDGESKPGTRASDVVRVCFQSTPRFGTLNWVVLGIYLAVMLGIGFRFMRREKGTDDFFRAGGRIPWWAAGISIYATMLSAITYMTIPAKAYTTDWTYYPILAVIVLAIPVVTKYYLPHFRRLNLTSAYEYLEVRFNRATRVLASGLFIVFMVARMSLVLYLPSLALTAVTGIDINTCILLMGLITVVYCTLGGVEAVIWGDVVQGTVLVAGALGAAAYLLLSTDGGMAGAWHIALDDGKMRLFDWGLSPCRATFWVAIIGGFANNLIFMTSDQTAIQRYLTTKDERAAGRSIWSYGLMCVFISIFFYIIGTGLYTFYKTHPQALDLTMQGNDTILPFFMMTQLPQGLAGLLIAAIFAATMSTISSNINSVATAFSTDFWQQWRPKGTERERLWVARLTCVVAGLVGTGMALTMATWDIVSLLDYFNTIMGLLTSTVGALFFMGVFLPRIDGRAALAGFAVGTATVFALQAFTRISFFLFGAVGIAVSVAVALLASLLTRKRA